VITSSLLEGVASRLSHAVARRVRPPFAALEEWLIDRRLGAETGGQIEVGDLDVTAGEAALGHGYTASPAPLLRWLFREIDVPQGDYTFVDMGSGKGRTLIAAAGRGYRNVIGVEFAADLHEIAQANIARRGNRIGNVELVLGDAGELPIPAGPLVVYFNNPFTEPVMIRVLANITASYRHDRRPMVLAYQQLADDDDPTGNLDLLSEVPFLRASDRRPLRPYDRLMLSSFVLRIFVSPEVDKPTRAA
jgi:SAM-dependent methyltransferase